MKCLPDIIYDTETEASLDLFVPDALRSNACIVLISGSARPAEDKVALRLAERFTEASFSVAMMASKSGVNSFADRATVEAAQRRAIKAGVSVNPALLGRSYYAAVESTLNAVAYLTENAGDLGIASLNVGVFGLATGGITAMGTAFPPREFPLVLKRPKAVAAIGGALVQPWRVDASGPPCVLVNAERDTSVPADTAVLGVARAESLELDIDHMVLDAQNARALCDDLLDGHAPDHVVAFEKILALFARL